MKIHNILYLFIIFPFLTIGQNYESIYALNSGATTKQVVKGEKVVFNQPKTFPNSSYIKIKQKSKDSFYIQTIINGQFAYGHYFKYQSTTEGILKYIRTDGSEVEFITTNYSLSQLASSNKYDEKVRLELINYKTSFAMLLKF